MSIKVKTTDLEGASLDWAVAKCLHGNLFTEPYSTSWAHGGPIIERERISIIEVPASLGSGWDAKRPAASPLGYITNTTGQTPLIAAMRCYVASKLGDTVEIPKELIKC